MPEPDQIQGYLLDRGGMVINVKHPAYGAVGDGVANDAPAINSALEAARKTGEYGQGLKGAIVFFPPGIYRVNQPLDCNNGQFNLRGSGSHQTVIRGNTGDRAAIIEMVSGGHSSIESMLLDDLGMPNPSSVGVLYGRDQFAHQSLMMTLKDVSIRLRNNMNANLVTATDPQGNPYVADGGTVGIYNVGVEAFNVHNCFILADTGCFFGTHDPLSIPVRSARTAVTDPGYTGPPNPQLTLYRNGTSMTVVVFSGSNWINGMGRSAVRIDGGADFIIHAHLNNPISAQSTAGAYAIAITAQTTNVEYSGSVEGFPSVLYARSVVRGLRLHAYTHSIGTVRELPNGVVIPGEPRVFLDGGALLDSTLNVVPTPDTADATDTETQVEYGRGYLVKSGAAGATVAGSQIFLRKHRIDLGSGSLHGNVILVETALNDPAYAGTPRLSAATQSGNVVVSRDRVQVSGPAFGPDTPAAATQLGSVTRRMEVFDKHGASLGFVPIYNSIT